MGPGFGVGPRWPTDSPDMPGPADYHSETAAAATSAMRGPRGFVIGERFKEPAPKDHPAPWDYVIEDTATAANKKPHGFSFTGRPKPKEPDMIPGPIYDTELKPSGRTISIKGRVKSPTAPEHPGPGDYDHDVKLPPKKVVSTFGTAKARPKPSGEGAPGNL